jgi:hypothetical protein
MIHISLPIVRATDPLREVLRQMREMNVSGAVWEQDDKYWLLYAREVIFAFHEEPDATVGTVSKRVRLAGPSKGRPRSFLQSKVEGHIADNIGGYGLLKIPEGPPSGGDIPCFVVQIKSASMEKDLTSSPWDCFCDRNGERVTGHRNGDKCPNADGGTVCCG